MRLGKDTGDDDDASAATSWSDEWKVLVLDASTRAIITPLVSIKELRAMGVTLFVSLEAPRDPIPDVSAIYFVRPSDTSLRAILEDTAATRYRDATLHFSSPLPRAKLEALARGCVEVGAAARVRRVTDAWMSFVALEPRLFSLLRRESFSLFHSPASTQEAIEAGAEEIATGLFCALGTCGAVPIIVASPGAAAEEVAKALNTLIRDHLGAVGGGLFGVAAAAATTTLPSGRRPVPLGLGAGARPVLLLLDRDVDLGAPLAHPTTYRALLNETLGPIDANKVKLPDAGAGGGDASGVAGASSSWLGDLFRGGASSAADRKSTFVPLDPDGDPFWRAYAGADFPVAIEAGDSEVANVQAREAAIRRSGASTGADAASAVETDAGESEATLTSAIDSLPALLARKNLVSTHMTLLTGVMSAVKSRLIPEFTEVENAARATPLDRAAVLALIRDPSKGTLQDRARLAALHVLSFAPLDERSSFVAALDAETESVSAALRESVPPTTVAGADAGASGSASPAFAATTASALADALAAVNFAKRTRTVPGGVGPSARAPGASGAGGSMLEAAARGASSLLTRGLAAATRLVSGGDERAPIARLTAAVCEGKPALAGGALAGSLESYLVFDARAAAVVPPKTYGAYLASVTAAANAAAGGAATSAALLASGSQFKNAFVFLVGGGAYEEYASVQRYAEGVPTGGGAPVARTIVYGATEMLSPNTFLSEIARLGK